MKHGNFLRVAAIASWLSVITTLMLIFLPELFAPAQGFEARMDRVYEPAYIARAWAYLLHPFVVLTAALGVTFLLRDRSPVLALIGIIVASLHASPAKPKPEANSTATTPFAPLLPATPSGTTTSSTITIQLNTTTQ